MPKKSADPEIIDSSSSVNVGSLKVSLEVKITINDTVNYYYNAASGYVRAPYEANNNDYDLDSGKPCAALLASIFSRITGG